MKWNYIGCAAALMLVLFGCSSLSVQRYTSTSENGDNPSKIRHYGKGFEFPRPEPYLLVKRTEADKKITDVQVVYLADWKHTTVVKQRPFIGSSELGFTTNGALMTSFNAKQDSKTEALLSGASGLASGLTGLAAGIGGAAGQIGGMLNSASGLATTIDGIISRHPFSHALGGGPSGAAVAAGTPWPPSWVDTKEEKAVFAAIDDARNISHSLVGALLPGGQQQDATKLATDLDELVDTRLPLVCFTCADELRVLRRRVIELHERANKQLPKGDLSSTPGGGADGCRNALDLALDDTVKALEAAIGLLDLQQLGPFELYKIVPGGLIPVKVILD